MRQLRFSAGNVGREREMIEVKREHLAGLQLVLDEIASGRYPDLRVMIAQASAAPEQEPVAWTWQGTLDRLKTGDCPDGEVVYPHRGPGVPIALYTHADPSEVEQLKQNHRMHAARLISGKVQLRETLEAATQRADAAERVLGEVMGLLREEIRPCLDVWANYEPVNTSGALILRIDALLSASAEPAADHCPGDGVNPCKECPDRVELREACKRFVDSNKPAKGGDGEDV